HNRRYAYLLIAVIAAALPGVDPITMLIEMVPLLALYELSILLARALGRPRLRRAQVPEALEPEAQE
ncbi:MAG: twin-arginine translocase subunit TatC, partial [Solirubrobacterales bacterium]